MYRLVDKINDSIGQDATSKSLIGVLDIYGFESFKHNRYLDVKYQLFKFQGTAGVSVCDLVVL